MTYPVVEAVSVHSREGTGSNTASYPSGTSAGDLLVVFIRMADGSGLMTTPFTDLFTPMFALSTPSNEKIWVYARVMDGTEGGTVLVAPTVGRTFVMQFYRISGHAGLDGVAAQAASGLSLDPPSVSAPLGSADNLYIAFAGGHYTTFAVNAMPAGYADLVTAVRSGSSATDAYSWCATATKFANSASDDPAAWDITSGLNYKSATVVIGPSAGESRHRSPLMLTPW